MGTLYDKISGGTQVASGGGLYEKIKLQSTTSASLAPIQEPKKLGFIGGGIQGAKDVASGELSIGSVAKEVPNVIKKGASSFVNTFAPAITNLFKTTGGIIGEGLAYAVDPEVRKQFKAGHLDVLPTITETTQADVAKATIAAGIETAAYRVMPQAIQSKLLARGGIGALQGAGFAISEGLVKEESPEDIVKNMGQYGVAGAVIEMVAPYLVPLLKKDIAKTPKFVKNMFGAIDETTKLKVQSEGAGATDVPIKKGEPVSPDLQPRADSKIVNVFSNSDSFAKHNTTILHDELLRKGITSGAIKPSDDVFVYHGTPFWSDILESGRGIQEGIRRNTPSASRGGISVSDDLSRAFGFSQDQNVALKVRTKFQELAPDTDTIKNMKSVGEDVKNSIEDSILKGSAARIPTQEFGIESILVKTVDGKIVELPFKAQDSGLIVDIKRIQKANTKSQLTDFFNKVKGGVDEIGVGKVVPEEKVKVPREQLPVGEGKTKVSGLEARMRSDLKRITPEVAEEKGISTFQQMNKKGQLAKAAKYVQKNPDDALAVLKGEKQAPKGLLDNSIALAMEKHAENVGDAALSIRLASLRSTRLGQELSLLTELDPSNPITQIKQIVEARTERATRRIKSGNTVAKEVSKTTKEASKALKKSELKIETAEKLLDSILC